MSNYSLENLYTVDDMTHYLSQVDESVDIEIWYFDAKAKDDLFDELKKCFLRLMIKQLKKNLA